MNNEKIKKTKLRKWVLTSLLVLFDIFAVNCSYYLAMVVRFYVKGQFHPASVRFFPILERFAPYYTVCCIVVFALFKLYNGMWRYAGLSDINRVLQASIVTCLIQVFGTLLFFGRMPITYYAIGAAIQFVFTFLSRFSYRFVAEEIKRYSKGKNVARINTMIVGVGESAQILVRQLETDAENAAHPVCVLDSRSTETGRLFNGLPVLGALDSMQEGIEKYNVKNVIIADSLLPQEERNAVRKLCAELNIGVQDFSGYSQSLVSGIALRSLMELVSGPVDVVLDDSRLSFDNGEQASMTLTEKYVVKGLRSREDRLVVEIRRDHTVLNDINDDWAKAYHAETGEDISFF